MYKFPFLAIFAVMLFGRCLVMDNQYSKLPPGKWRAVLKLEASTVSPNPKGKPLPDKVDMTFPDVEPGELPFNFEVVYDNDSTFHIEIINGGERILVEAKDIRFGRGKNRAQDTIRIDFPVFDSYITGSFAGNTIEGSWVVSNRENYAIPFIAHQGKDYRFTAVKNPPAMDLTGKWKTTFGIDGDEPEAAIGEFRQQGNLLTGTFMTETGDYRYLEGTVQGDKAWLSVFDGSHAFLFEMKILPDSTLTGAYYSGKHYRTLWEAHREAAPVLAHPDSLTFLKPGYDKFEFAFENPDGKLISLAGPAYQGKKKIIQIMGTWCPNCRDETAFLVNYLKENNPPNLAVIALAFERHTDKEKALNALRTYKNHFGMDYELLLAGSSDKKKAALALPMLNHVLSYPTMVFLDENNRVLKIHTGFNGPATSQYEAFTSGFDAYIKQITGL